MDNAAQRTRNMKSSETATTDLLVAGRNQLFLEPFDAFDPHHPLRGKKRFNENFRPLRSKISLKFGNDLITDVKKKQGMKLDIKQSVIDDFDRVYAINCDQKKMRTKHRKVSPDNPFDENNIPPKEHLIPNKILEKPGRINIGALDGSQIPMAGRLGELGKMILSGGKEAKHMTTGPWDVIQQEYIPRAIRGRPPAKMVSEKVQNNTKTIVRGEASDFENFNFGQLHRTHIYPNK